MLSRVTKQRKLEILDWLEQSIENGVVEDRMVQYAPTVELKISIDLSDNSVPKEIMERIKAKYYTRDEDDS